MVGGCVGLARGLQFFLVRVSVLGRGGWPGGPLAAGLLFETLGSGGWRSLRDERAQEGRSDKVATGGEATWGAEGRATGTKGTEDGNRVAKVGDSDQGTLGKRDKAARQALVLRFRRDAGFGVLLRPEHQNDKTEDRTMASKKGKNKAAKVVVTEMENKEAKKPCPCGCGGMAPGDKGLFLPGHDGRVCGWLLAVASGNDKRIAKIPEDRLAFAKDTHKRWNKAGQPGGTSHPKVRALFG